MTPEYRAALSLATLAHEGQKRKDGKPYITHPIGVSALVMEYGSVETWPLIENVEVIAALLHDVVEDRPKKFVASCRDASQDAALDDFIWTRLYSLADAPQGSSQNDALRWIRLLFGEAVFKIVDDLTNYERPLGNASREERIVWVEEQREKKYKKLRTMSSSSAFVAACDKLHNIRSIAHRLEYGDMEILKNFVGGPKGIIDYYTKLYILFENRPEFEIQQIGAAIRGTIYRSFGQAY